MTKIKELETSRSLLLHDLKCAKKLLEGHVEKRAGVLVNTALENVKIKFGEFREIHLKIIVHKNVEFDNEDEMAMYESAMGQLQLAESIAANYFSEEKKRGEVTSRQNEVAKEEVVRADIEARFLCQKKRFQTLKVLLEEDFDPSIAMESLNECEGQFKELQEEIQAYLRNNPSAKRDDFKAILSEINEDVFIDIMKSKFKVKPRMKEVNMNADSEEGSDFGATRCPSSAKGKAWNCNKNERLPFPKFSGDSGTYMAWKRMFKANVIDTEDYSEEQLLNIVQNSCLKGKAAEEFKHYHDYKRLMDDLDKKYINETEIMEKIFTGISECGRIKEEDYAGIIKLTAFLEESLLTCEAIDLPTLIGHPHTIPCIVRVLYPRLRDEIWAIYEKKKRDPYQAFLDVLEVLRAKRSQALQFQRVDGIVPKFKAKAHVATGKAESFQCATPGCNYKKKHFLSSCNAFKRMDVNERGKVVLDGKLCVLCFNNHKVANCPKTKEWKKCNIDDCEKWHNRLLHGANVQGLTLVGSGDVAKNVLLLVQKIPVQGSKKKCTVLFDQGSTISLVTENYAKTAGLEGTEVSLDLSGVGNKTETLHTKLYKVPLLDKEKNLRNVHAFGMKEITSKFGKVDVSKAAKLFGLEEDVLSRPVGNVDLLVGYGRSSLFPRPKETVDDLTLHESQFGTGYVLGGEDGTKETTDGANFTSIVAHAMVKNVKTLDFISAEAFGIDAPRYCKNCGSCKECSFLNRQLTWTEAKELVRFERGLKFDTLLKKWIAEYQYNTDPSILKDNYGQAFSCLKSLEKRLIKSNQMENFNEQFKDAIDRGVFEEISQDQMTSYDGPVNYITITEAYKDGDQATTPLRLCMNSSMSFQGVSLNDILLKGPSSLNNIYSVLINFRTYKVGLVKDLSKFYQSVLASPRDQHLRRVLWRDGDVNAQPKVYITKTVNFGDKPAGCVALTAVRETADLFKHIDPDAADKLKRDNYVDDIASGADSLERAKELSQNMDEIVSQGGFKFKNTILSGDKGDPIKVLGTKWDMENDDFMLEVKVNISDKKKGVRVAPNMDLNSLKENFPQELTKRMIWRIVLGQFDPIGLACVFMVRLKLIMRELSDGNSSKLGWDDPVPVAIKDKFLTVLGDLSGVSKIRFPRSIKPDIGMEEGNPELLCFGDGSKQAFCALAYVRWQVGEGEFKCFLLSGKTRVAPLRKISIPRIELMGAVACVRLAESISNAVNFEFKKRYFFTDSTAALGMIKGECASFQEFVGTRTGEIKSKSDPDKEWFWIPTDQNLADMGTREDVKPKDIEKGSVYQCGLPWMQKDFEFWPVKESVGVKVPEEELTTAAKRVMVATVHKPLIDGGKFSSFKKLIRVTAMVFKAVKIWKKEKGTSKPALMQEAEHYWMVQAQKALTKKFEKGELSSLRPTRINVEILGREETLITTSGRVGGALLIGYDKEYLPILEYESFVSKLIMRDAHAEEHCGEDRTLWRSRNVAWVIKGRRIAKQEKKNCFRCKIRDKVPEKQIMAPLPEHRLPPAPVFHSTAVDLFGPLEVVDTVKRRTSRKCWGVVFVCTVTSAVHLEVTEDYSCDSFLLCLRRFMNVRGTPARFQSDPGTQLMAAAKELGKWDFSKVENWAANQMIDWHFIPAGSQHCNGIAEAMIKVTKRQLTEVLKSKKLTKGELDTVLSDVANIINSRPLMKRPGEDPLAGSPITPNHLLGGRSSNGVPVANVDSNPTLTKRLKFIELMTQEFWVKWFAQVFHNLVPNYKWKTSSRNVVQGDIVLLKDSNVLKREYRLARVKEVIPGDDGHVRRVVLEYKNHGSKKSDNSAEEEANFSTTERSIHNIVVIVPNS